MFNTNTEFEKALKKISPEDHETLKNWYDAALRKVETDIANPLLASSKSKKQFDTVINNLDDVRNFVIEEAKKLNNDDEKGKVSVMEKYADLLEEVRNQSEYLFGQLLDEVIGDMEKEAQGSTDRANDVIKEADKNPPPTDEEIDRVLKSFD